MFSRSDVLENFAGDLEYHPRRALLYLGLGGGSLCFWIFSLPENKFTTIPLVFALGALPLLLKAIFLLRKSSEGLGLTQQELTELSSSSNHKNLPPITNQAAQIIQDFGAGPLALWPLLNFGKDINHLWHTVPRIPVFFTGAILFSLGWVIRRLTSPPKQ